MHRVTLWRHRKREEAKALGIAGVQAADRKLAADWKKLYKRSLRAGNLDSAARALSELSQIQQRLAAPPPKSSKLTETVWRVTYENPEDTPEIAERNAAITGVRQALENQKLTRPARRNALITELAAFFGVQRERAEALVSEIEKAKPKDWEEGTPNHVRDQNPKLLVEEAEGAHVGGGAEGNSQANEEDGA